MRPHMLGWGFAMCLIGSGCPSKSDFVQIAPGVSISETSIQEYAEQNGLSHSEARRRLAAEMMSSGDAGATALAGDQGAATEAD